MPMWVGSVADPSECCVNSQGCSRRAQGIVVMRPRRAEQRHHRITDMHVDRASVADDDAVHLSSEPTYQFTDFFRIQRSRQGREPAKVGKEDRDLPTFAGRAVYCPRKTGRRRRLQIPDSSEQPLAMTQRGHTKFFEIRFGEPAQNFEINVVLDKGLGILGQSQIPQPLFDSHQNGSPGKSTLLHMQKKSIEYYENNSLRQIRSREGQIKEPRNHARGNGFGAAAR